MAAFTYSSNGQNNVFGYGTENTSALQGQENFNRTSIKSLTPHQHNTLVVGLVLAKVGVRSFPDKKNPGNTLWKLMLTIRDTPADHINIVCWGSEEYITRLNSSFIIGDVVEIRNPNIQTKGSNPVDERWRPTTSSPYQMVLSERYSSLTTYSGWDHADFLALSRIPVCSIHDYQTLASVMSLTSTQADGSQNANILAVVRSVGAEKQITGKTGRQLQRCEVRLMDPTCPNFSLFFWDKHLIDMAQNWTPKQTVVFIVDAQVKYDSFRQAVVATCGPKTVIITNPDCPEGHKLFQFGQQADIPLEVEDNDGTTDISTISDLYTVKQLKTQMSAKPEYTTSMGFTGFMFAVVTTLDINAGDFKRIVGSKCGLCKARMLPDSNQCQNSQCSSFGTTVPMEYFFDFRIALADHTDSISAVRLSDQPAENFLWYTVSYSPQVLLNVIQICSDPKIHVYY
jgi:hypothetical protein